MEKGYDTGKTLSKLKLARDDIHIMRTQMENLDVEK